MSPSYVAYGMQLDSDFPLPGMRTGADGSLPRLRLELDRDGPAREELEAPEAEASTPSSVEREWSGWLGDGCELSIDRRRSGERLFSYGERARFHLAADQSSLRCRPLRDDLHWQRALLTKVLPSVSVMRGYEALHASAVDSPRGAVAIAAPAGMGKSTLALELMRRGWPLLSDDVLVLSHDHDHDRDHERGTVRAHPGTPHMNLDPGSAATGEDGELAETLELLAGERWVSAYAAAQTSRPVGAVFLLERAPGLSLEVERLAPSPLPLSPYVLGLAPDAERRRRRFVLYGALMDAALLLRLTCSPADSPALVADAVEGALESRPQAAECVA